MSDITFELGAEAGDDVTFDLGAQSGDDVSFNIPEPGTVDLTGVALLAAENLFTETQRIDLHIPVTPLADIATTRPTTLLHMHLPEDGGVLTEFIATAVDFGGGFVVRGIGTLVPAYDPATGAVTDTWEMTTFGFLGTDDEGDPLYRRVFRRVESSTPGEMPSIGDIFGSSLAPLSGGTPVLGGDFATKDYTDALVAALPDTAALDARALQIAQAERTTPPTRWLVGGVDPGYGTKWTGLWQAPDATETLVIEDWIRVISAREPGFYETVAESLDGLGDVDRFERAGKVGSLDGAGDDLARLDHFSEGTAPGATTEWQRPPNAQQDFGALSPLAAGVWVRGRSEFDFTAHTITHYVENDVIWDYEANGRKWATTGVYTNPGITGLHPTAGHPTWLGRGVGEFHIADVRMWVDGVEVMHPDIAGAEIGATTVVDGVAVDEFDAPIEWLGTDGAVVDGPAAAGGGVELGETTTTAYRGDRGKTAYDHSQVVTGNPHGTTAADVGAATTGHNHSGVYDPAGSAASAQASAIAASQPVDSDLTAIAALTTTSFGRSLLTQADAAATLATIGAASATAVPFRTQVGDWVSQPHDSIYAATQTLNRVAYVPYLVPAGFAQTDGIAIEVTTVAASALCRLGLYLPHATTGRPGALVIDGGTVDLSSGGGVAGVRTLTITATNLTPGSLVYVAVVPQGATAATRHTSSGEMLRLYGYSSSTVTDVFRTNSASAYYENSVTGALPANATPIIGSVVGQPVVALRRSA